MNFTGMVKRAVRSPNFFKNLLHFPQARPQLLVYVLKYAADPNLSDEIGQFDTILRFETIEHIQEEVQFLNNIFKLLKPNGTLILSTPFGKGRNKPCGIPFHVHQLTKKEFKNLFNDYPYASKELFFQKGVFITPADFDAKEHYSLGTRYLSK